ncbi:MAG: NrtA/SsuA/CpmA family ABC transporter substrate-binding protein [Chloroflexi bacterium]|nr:NrtA/SsuA/CpmA family ABC transporter substrate-binding protein [Chloroflexota bacterium]
MKRIRLPSQLVRVITLVSLFGTMLGLLGCQSSYSGKLEPITIGMESTAVNALIYIAAEQNYFAQNGLNVTLKEYPSGLAAVNGMLKNEVDLATAAEFVLVGKAFAQEDIRALTSIDRFQHISLIGRRDRGIDQVSDLKGKKIGVPLQTAAEFYLGRFLDLNGMNIQQVTLVNVSPPDSVNALVNATVDAVIVWQPNVRAIEDRLGNGLIKWKAQKEQFAYCTLMSTDKWISGHLELVKRFLNALIQAENFYQSRAKQAQSIVQKRLEYDDAYMAVIWQEHQISISLDQSLILALEDQARWMIRNNLTDEKTTPNFLDYISEKTIQALKPQAVNIIR